MRNTPRRPLARPRRPASRAAQPPRAHPPRNNPPSDPANPRGLVEFVAKSLVEKPEAVSVTQRGDRNSMTLRLKVAPEETGRVIGREGRFANAVRTLLKVISARTRKRIVLDIGD